jgi:hypothetical protein
MLTGNVGSQAGTTAPSSMLPVLIIAAVVTACLSFWPDSGVGPAALTDWQDQATFLRATTQTLEHGLPDSETRTLVGPAYVGLALAVGWISGLDPGQSLVLLSRLTFIACAAILATVAARYRAQADVGFQIGLGAIALMSLATSVWFRFFDIPWTHFVAGGLLGAMVLASLARMAVPIRSVLVGALAIALVQTRLFEALVVLVAAAMILPLAIARYWRSFRNQPAAALLQVALPAIVGGVLAFAAVGAVSHNWSLYQQYSDQAGMILALELAPLKAVQLFWDTCFATVCEFAAASVGPVVPDSLNSWRQPLSLQLPGLIAAAAGLLALFALRPARVLQLPLGVLFAILGGGGLVLAYVAGAPSGSPHLKYGFFRDFVPALILLTCAFIGALAAQRAEDGRTTGALVVPLLVYFVVLFGLTALRPVGLPQFSEALVARFEIASSCSAGDCAFSLRALGASGEALPYNNLVYVSCAGDPQFRPIWRLTELRADAAHCLRVAIVPLASGLLYAPEGNAMLETALDLSLPADIVSIPDDTRPQPASSPGVAVPI